MGLSKVMPNYDNKNLCQNYADVIDRLKCSINLMDVYTLLSNEYNYFLIYSTLLIYWHSFGQAGKIIYDMSLSP